MPATTYDETTYGRIADTYDEFYATRVNTDNAVEFLACLAGNRRVLELGIGTGRIALPLAARGIKVSGIDASNKMVQKLREKAGGDAIPVAMGNFADVQVSGQYSLIYVVFNTFFALLTQEAQIRCFSRIARRLTDDGAFVMEAFVPDLTRFDRDQRTSVIHIDNELLVIETSMHDFARQFIRAGHAFIREDGTRIYPVQLRYAWPSELDLMARLAGMRLRERFGGWKREPFTAASGIHVSVYEKIPTVVTLPKPAKTAPPVKRPGKIASSSKRARRR